MKKAKELFNSNSGITLIALVVTIIILIILAGISINLVLGENGIITKASEAKDLQTEAEEKESISLAVVASQMSDNASMIITKTNLEKELKQQFGNDADLSVSENGDGSFIVDINDTNRTYYIDSTGEIISNSNILEISTAEELKAFRDEVNSGNTFEGKYIFLINDITLDMNEQWIPIGTTTNAFKGFFYGNNHSISGIYIRSEEINLGLFGFSKGTIKNIKVYGTISGNQYAGGICGRNESGLIEGCGNFINVEGIDNYIGGITGRNNSTGIIKKCYNAGEIKGNKYVGGIAGQSNGGPIENSYNIGNIEGNFQVGGITGYNVGNIKNCYNTKIINGNNSGIGGISGMNLGTIEKCYNIALLYGEYNFGTISGLNSSIIKDCYSLLDDNLIDGTQSDGSSYDVEKLEDNQLKTLEFIEKLNNNLTEKIWKNDTENINNGYPILSWQ